MRPKQKQRPSFTETSWEKVRGDPKFAKTFFEAYLKESLPIQVTLLRTLTRIPQIKLAKHLGVKQTHLSRLEKDGTDHVISIYKKMGKALHAKLALIPDDAEIVLRKFAHK